MNARFQRLFGNNRIADALSGFVFRYDEHHTSVGAATVPGTIAEIVTPPDLIQRRIYFHFAASAVAGVKLIGRIVCYLDGAEVGSVPFRQNGTANNYYSFPGSNQSGISGHNGADDTLWYRDAGGATFGQVSPIRVNVACEMVRFKLDQYDNGGAGTLQLYLGCLSQLAL